LTQNRRDQKITIKISVSGNEFLKKNKIHGKGGNIEKLITASKGEKREVVRRREALLKRES